MPKGRSKEEVYAECDTNGMFIPQTEIDIERIRSMIEIAEEDIQTVNELKNKDNRLNTLYKLNYDIIPTLCEAFLLFDKIKSLNHQCLFSHLCVKHPELELDWNFFEKIRTKRNGIHYYGSGISRDDWRDISVQVFIYIKALKQALKDKIDKYDKSH